MQKKEEIPHPLLLLLKHREANSEPGTLNWELYFLNYLSLKFFE